MPIEIKELNIRINVNQNRQEQDNVSPQIESHDQEGGEDKNAIIAECVEQVMELLKNKQDR